LPVANGENVTLGPWQKPPWWQVRTTCHTTCSLHCLDPTKVERPRSLAVTVSYRAPFYQKSRQHQIFLPKSEQVFNNMRCFNAVSTWLVVRVKTSPLLILLRSYFALVPYWYRVDSQYFVVVCFCDRLVSSSSSSNPCLFLHHFVHYLSTFACRIVLSCS
jgi:hypothetical protein